MFFFISNISDAYIPTRRVRGRSRFDFVRYWAREEAIKSIYMFDNSHLRGRKLFVCWVRHQKQRKHTYQHGRKTPSFKQIWRRKEHHDQKNKVSGIRFSQESQPIKHYLRGEVNLEFEEWLKRSLMCTTKEPRDLAALVSAINNGFYQCTKIYALSSFKFILTFPTNEMMEETLNNHEELDFWLCDVQRWSNYEYCDTRKIWLEIYRAPPGWLWENFKNISQIWERMICLGKSII